MQRIPASARLKCIEHGCGAAFEWAWAEIFEQERFSMALRSFRALRRGWRPRLRLFRSAISATFSPGWIARQVSMAFLAPGISSGPRRVRNS